MQWRGTRTVVEDRGVGAMSEQSPDRTRMAEPGSAVQRRQPLLVLVVDSGGDGSLAFGVDAAHGFVLVCRWLSEPISTHARRSRWTNSSKVDGG